MKNCEIVFFLLLSIIVVSINNTVDAYDNEYVHKKVNKNAVLQSNLGYFLDQRLGFSKGIETKVNIKEVWEWFEEGGKQEDVPVERTLRHFHDPLKAWNSSGFKGEGLPSLLWAQDQSNFRGSYGGDWSWKKAREFYYSALISTSWQQREQGFANAFRALGPIPFT